MITDKETNILYFSEEIFKEKYNPAFQRVKIILDRYGVKYDFLKGTKDIWCRDYMPMQVDRDKFVQFRYEPIYLEKELNLQSNPGEVIRKSNLKMKPYLSNINLDGGNVVKGSNSVIITDRIFTENDRIDKGLLVQEIESLLETKVHLIPCIKNDMTGHADGHVRYINKETLIVNALEQELKYWQIDFHKMIHKSGFKYVEMPWFEYADNKNPLTAIGIYVNYLEIGNLIIFPIFGVPGNKDNEALEVIRTEFPKHNIETVNINEIANEGGLLNCATWSIMV